MQIKRFEAKDMTSALRLIKTELGPDAVILSARSLKKENKLLGLVKSAGVEVTAAVDSYHLLAESKNAAFSGVLNTYRRYAQNNRPKPQHFRRGNGSRAKWRNERQPPQPSYDKPRIAADDPRSDLYKHLLAQEVKRDLATEIIAGLDRQSARGRRNTADALIAEIVAVLHDKKQPTAARSLNRSGARVVAVVGPTGVGKTTTIAKLAARHAIEQHQHVALISLDSYRIGASAELNVYAQAIGTPFKTAATRAAFKAAVDGFREVDLILVDTPGLNPANPDEVDALKACLTGIDKIEIHLALSAMTKQSDLDIILKRLDALAVTDLIFTKLDESGTYGNIINLLSEHALPLSYLTSGRQEPAAIETGSLEKIVALLLGDFECQTADSRPLRKEPAAGQIKASLSEHQFVANKNSDVFHRSDCKWTRKIKPKHLITFSSAEVAKIQQFMPCRDCQPEKSKPFQIGGSTTRNPVRISNIS